VAASAENRANYALDKGITISSVTRVDPATVALVTSKMAEGTDYALTVSAIQDTASPANTIVANTKVAFKSFVFTTGYALHKFWENSTANTIAGLTNDARFPVSPTFVTIEPLFEYGPNALNESGSNYGNQLVGWFLPPSNGDYVFFTNSDDSSSLYLSTDDNPANKKLIAVESGWSNARNWVSVGGGSVLEDKRSDLYSASEWPTPNTITLQAGRRYYIEALHSEGGGGDSVAATFIKVGDTDPANGTAPAIGGPTIGVYLNPNGASVDITQPPQPATAQEGLKATFRAAATGISAYGSTVSYQWQKAAKGSTSFSNIAGATDATYKTPALALSEDGSQYRVVATVPTLSVNSAAAILTVVPDTFPPVPTAGALPSSTAGTIEVGVGFDEAMDNTSGAVAANYTIAPGTITGFTWYPKSQSALLKVTGLAPGASATVTVKNVADAKGNKITTATAPFTVSSTMKWGIVGASEVGTGSWVVPVSANGFDIYSDSIAEWGTYDEATFVYEQVTGDFDKKLRVEYQDNSSQWARAGLIVRDVTNFGVDRATQEGGEAGRYQKCHVNPVGPTMTGPGTAGNGAWETNRRLTTGAATTSANSGGAPVPYPDAWCRIVRTGQTFEMFRSGDGITWASLGTTTFDPPMPATLYVGPEFAAENGNVTNEADRGTWLAKIRDYGDYKVPSVSPTLGITRTATGVTLNFSGTLQSADSITGPWSDVAGASPQTVTPAGTKFYRAKN
jgi:hypothetical protein